MTQTKDTKSASRHTPGPWHSEPLPWDHGTRIANSKLMDAAPEMLKTFYLWVCGADVDDLDEAAPFAYAKATGRAV